jgi:hypothetical protein
MRQSFRFLPLRLAGLTFLPFVSISLLSLSHEMPTGALSALVPKATVLITHNSSEVNNCVSLLIGSGKI